MKNNKVRVTLLFIITFIAGLSFFYVVSKDIFIERDLASIHESKLSSLKFLSSDKLKSELSKRIKIYTIANEKVVALEGFSSQICKNFSHVELFFQAYGVSVSGEASTLKITSTCIPGQDPAEIAVIKIPFEKLLKEEARNAEFKFSGYKEVFELINGDEWSKTWILSQIVFKSATESKIIKVAQDSLSNNTPIVLEF